VDVESGSEEVKRKMKTCGTRREAEIIYEGRQGKESMKNECLTQYLLVHLDAAAAQYDPKFSRGKLDFGGIPEWNITPDLVLSQIAPELFREF
jgi:hypothetical protein